MFRVCVIAEANDEIRKLCLELVQQGLACSTASNCEEAVQQVAKQVPDLLLLAMDGLSATSEIIQLAERVRQELPLPIVALLSGEALRSLDSSRSIDDFVVEPWDATEIAVRAKRILRRTSRIDSTELIECGDLMIDLAQCKVCLSTRPIALTFREYELLRFLASNKGRVFTRDALLNKVWGYDYYGGDRTVDVHVRRLRTKIEGPDHKFIETVRNIGYRFRKET